jgi:hypothetical protein
VRIEAGVEIGPEPGDEEHHLGGDEHDHAVAQVQRHDAGVGALMGFLDRIGPPAEHHVEHDGEADEEQPGMRPFDAEDVQRAAIDVAHEADAAEGHDEGADRGQ